MLNIGDRANIDELGLRRHRVNGDNQPKNSWLYDNMGKKLAVSKHRWGEIALSGFSCSTG